MLATFYSFVHENSFLFDRDSIVLTIIIVTTTLGCCRGNFPLWYILRQLICFEFDNLLKLFFIRPESVSLFYIIWEKAYLLIVNHMIN